jgi:hypothetical protein
VGREGAAGRCAGSPRRSWTLLWGGAERAEPADCRREESRDVCVAGGGGEAVEGGVETGEGERVPHHRWGKVGEEMKGEGRGGEKNMDVIE